MLEKNDKNTELREYLLGNINLEENLTEIEEKLMTSKEYLQDFLIEEEDLIQDYVDAHLTPKERQNFEKLFLVSEDRRRRITFAYSLRQYISEQKPDPKKKIEEDSISVSKSFFQHLFRRPAFIGLLLLVIAGAISGIVIWRNFSNSSKDNEIISSLINKAYSNKRPFDARITEFAYAPIGTTLRGAGDKEDNITDSNALEEAKTLAFKAVRENPTPENLHNLGRVYLVQKDFAKAAVELEKAQALAPKNASILSDLGISYLEQSKQSNAGSKNLDYKAKALNTVEAALELDPNLPEARFNKAFCLQELKANEEARAAWQEYLKLDPNSKWADEARRNLDRLQSGKSENKNKDEALQAFLISYRNKDDDLAWKISSREREMIKGKLIPQQLAFSFLQADGKEKSDYLAALKYAGRLEKQYRKDPYFSELADYYAKTSGAQQKLLKQAHEFMHEGFELSLKNKYLDSDESFNNAAKLYTAAGDIWEAKLAGYWAAFSQYNLANLSEHKRVLEELVDFCQKGNYRWFLAEIYIWLGVNAEESTEFSRAIDYQKKAVSLCEEISDIYNLQKSLAILAEDYIILKQDQLLLESIQKGLVISAQYPETSVRQKWRTFNTAAKGFYSLKYYLAAADFEKEALAIGKNESDITFSVTSNLNLGIISGRQQKYLEAIDFLNQSREFAETLHDKDTRERYLSSTYTELATFKRLLKDCDGALTDYDTAIKYNSGQFKVNEYNARKGRLLCYVTQKNQMALQAELSEVLGLFEQNRRKITEEESRNAFFDNEQNIYDLAIDYEYGNGNYKQAFNYSETSRSRSLLDLLKYGPNVSEDKSELKFAQIAEPLDLDRIRQQLPEKVQVVEYTVLDDKVLIWLITKDNFAVFSSPISSDELNNKLSSYLNTLKNPTGAEKGLSRELYKILISPVIDKLDPSKEISFVPDKFLFQLPFSALVSPLTGKFLVEDFNTFYAPSANILLLSSARAEEKSLNSAQENILIVGNPAFDKDSFPDLPDLPGADREAQNIKKVYPNAVSLIDRDATKSEIKLKFPDAEIIHFAGHYVVDNISPMRSFLVLAGTGEDARLSNYDLMEENLSPNTKLIILSACQTGVERYYNGEGMIGASRTFLGMGVPLVIASQWKVDSDATGILMSKFHQYRKDNNRSSSEALRQAQLDMINGQSNEYKEPFYWAGFAPIGGYTKF